MLGPIHRYNIDLIPNVLVSFTLVCNIYFHNLYVFVPTKFLANKIQLYVLKQTANE